MAIAIPKLKAVVVTTLSVLFLVWFCAIGVINGGVWGVAQTTDTVNGTTHDITLHFGFTEYRRIEGGVVTESFYEHRQREFDMDAAVRIDYDDALVAGKWVGISIAIGLIVLTLSIIFHMFMWPLNKFIMIQRLAFPSVVVSAVSFVVAAFMWGALGMPAAGHIAVNRFPRQMPNMEYGWCYGLLVVIALCTTLACLLSYCALKRAELVARGLGENYRPPAEHISMSEQSEEQGEDEEQSF